MKQLTLILTSILITTLFIGSCKKDENTPEDNQSGENTNVPTSLTDSRDGQTYSLVEIGTQVWFAENLRYSGSIQQVSGDANWAAIDDNNTQQPAWCYYDDDPANDAIYGKLYNWYAVNTGTLCPSGWHIPTDAEWTLLTNYLGGASAAGGKIKDTELWPSPNTNATNSSGFSGLPGGLRMTNGYSNGMPATGGWWSSSQDGAALAWARWVNYNDGYLGRDSQEKGLGHPCRCIMD